MNIKNFLLIVAKNAVNAIATSGALAVIDSGNFNFHSADGWWNIGKACLAAVVAREIATWGPIVLKWSTTNADPNVTVIQTPPGQPNVVEVVKPVEPKP
jgi:hypothetical protein